MKNLLLSFLLISSLSYGQAKQKTVPTIKNPFSTKQVQPTKGIITPSSNLSKKQQQPSKKVKTVNGSFMLNFETDTNLVAKGINAKGTKHNLAQQFNDWFGLKKEHSFQLVSEKTDNYNTTHYNYQQQYNGFTVYGGTVLLHYKDGNAYAVNGKIAEFDNLDTSIVITEAQALVKAKAYKKVTELIKEYPIEKVIYKTASETSTTGYTLAYKVRIDAYKPFVMANVFVDAKTGEVINDITLIAHADTPATANTIYSGVQTITTDLTNGVYTLKDNARNIETYNGTNMPGLTPEDGLIGAEIYSNNSTTWGGIPTIERFTIDQVSSNWWEQSNFGDSEPDIYIKVKDASNNVVFNNRDSYENNFLPTPLAPLNIFLNIYLTNPPYTYEVWDYDPVGSDDFGGSDTLLLNDGLNNWNAFSGNGRYVVNLETPNPALDVHWGMGVTYDYYLNTFGRDSYDGNGSVIKNYFNLSNEALSSLGRSQNSAFALGGDFNSMIYGVGDGINMNPVVGLDVAGHEFTHLVINNNGPDGLVYARESGALNESFADIFGTSIEFYSGINPDWLIGEDVTIATPALRSMSNPNIAGQPDTYEGDFWYEPNCGIPTNDNDKCGVHINSGVQNYWFYLLSEGGSGTNDLNNIYSVTGIGIDNAAQIAYRNLTTHLLSSTSNYYDSFLGSLQAAQYLYGISSQEYRSVRQAWYAVGIGNDPNEQCSGTTNLTTETGVFSDGSGVLGNYLDNANCKWVIAPTGATQITVNFTEFDTENEYDFVTIYDGPDETFPVLATWWGNTLPPAITTTNGTGAMCVVFTSDISENFSGWKANYTATVVPPSCDGLTTLTNESDSFNDGSGLNNYVNNQLCGWHIAPPCASSITLSFTEFDTELNFDGIVVYDDLSGTNILGSFSGNMLPSNITSNTGEMFVVFISDYSTSFGGFNASYTSTDTPNHSLADTVLNTLDYGEISDGSGVNEYCNNTNSSWLIQPPQATSITLDFLEFDLEETSSDGNAIYDYVTVYDGIDSSSPILGLFSGSSLPPNLTSTGGSMFVTFNSDISNTFQGWSAYYTSNQLSICSNETLTADNGVLTDGSGTGDYANNAFCSWLIQPSNGNTINLTFTEFNTELDYDGVIVFDGIDENAPVLGAFTGNTLPELITSTGSSMYVLFISDESIRMNGWSASYDTNTLSIENEVLKNNIRLYPNPTTSVVYFDNSVANFETLEITNLLGQSIQSKTLDSSIESAIDLSSFENGVYLFRFKKQGVFNTFKVVKN